MMMERATDSIVQDVLLVPIFQLPRGTMFYCVMDPQLVCMQHTSEILVHGCSRLFNHYGGPELPEKLRILYEEYYIVLRMNYTCDVLEFD
jgi:hypothetical protein